VTKQLLSISLVLAASIGISAQAAKPARADALQDNLHKHISYLASEKLAGRRTGTEGASVAAGYIVNQFAKLGLRPGSRGANGKANYLQEFPYAKTGKPTVSGYNVIGILEGRDSELRKEAIVIGAHYDHLGNGGEGSLAATSTEVHPGADDNASGTAAVIEIARRFAREKNNKRTIVFIAFSGEEEGLFGSKHYVINPSFPIENTVAMFNLDMVGRLKDDKLTVGGVGTASEWKLKLATIPAVQAALDAAYRPLSIQQNEDGFGPSDHSSFYTKKIPVLFFFSGTHLFFFSGTHLDYHKPSDTADKINYEGEVRIIQLVASLIRSVDETLARPTYAVAKSSGAPAGSRSGFSISLGTIPSYTDSTDGMIIDGVRDDSPGSRAGLKGNDKIVMLAGKEVKNVQDYTKLLGEMKADVEYDVIVVRGGERLTLKITPVKRQ
jgi:aminopeptidase YwaD